MATNKIPVSFNFFKRYTYHEECVDFLIKHKANGNQQTYEALLNNKQARERALRCYYEAFYLKPKIREKHHIRLKPVPKKIKDKLLLIPVQDTCTTNEKEDVDESCLQGVIKILDSNVPKIEAVGIRNYPNIVDHKRRIMLAKQDASEEIWIVEDDSEPLSSPDVTSTNQGNEKVNSTTETQTDKAINDKEILPYKRIMEKDPNQEIVDAATSITITDSHKNQPTTVIAEKTATSVINNTNKENNKHQKTLPVYLKETKSLNEAQKMVENVQINVNKNSINKSQEIIDAAISSTIIDSRKNQPTAVIPEKNITSAINKNTIEENKNQQKTIPVVEATTEVGFNYEALIPYIHCCPLTYNKFCKYSNITELIRNFCETLKFDAEKQLWLLKRSYILFYLAPEHRTTTPLNKIQLLDNCPANIKDKFFSVPKKLYLKETKNLNKSQKILKNVEINKNSYNDNQEIVDAATSSTVTDSHKNQSAAAIPEKNANFVTNNTHKEDSKQQETIPVCLRETKSPNEPQKIVENVEININKNSNNENQEIVDAITSSMVTDSHKNQPAIVIPEKTAIYVTNNTHEENNKQQETISACLKQMKSPNEGQKKVQYLEINKNSNNKNKEIVAAATSSTITDSHKSQPAAVIPEKNTISVINNIHEIKRNANLSISHETNIQIQEENSQDSNQTTTKTTTTIHPNNCKETNSNDIQQKLIQSHAILPISLAKFKKYTHYEEAVEKLFKIKAQDNDDLFLKYKNSQEAFDSTLNNLYRAFYIIPAIRKICPIRLKPMPNFLKSSFVSIPDGVKETDWKNFKVEQLVSPELNAERKSTESQVQQTQECSNKNENLKKSYKDLLPYAHCCPITFSEFRQYTNISELFTDFCKKRYESLEKLPYILHRAYILHFLTPENRIYKPFHKLKILDKCPSNLRDKIFATPTNLYLQEDKNYFQKQDGGMQTETQTKIKMEILEKSHTQAARTNENQISNTIENGPKERIQILENRLLIPTTLPFSEQFNKDSRCSNTACVFCHISFSDFMKLTNILSILPKPHDITVIQNAFKKFVYKSLKEQNCDEKYVINSALMNKLLKYQKICENCEKPLINLNTTTTSSVSESDRVSNVTSATVVERCAANTERTQSIAELVTSADGVRRDPVIEKSLSSIENQTESSATNLQTQQSVTDNRQHTGLKKHLKRDEIFSSVCQKLLSELNQSHDDTVDFSSDCYKIFLECNEIPLTKILNNIFDSNDVQRILNHTELREALQRYYYYYYLTQHPDKIKQTALEENSNKRQEISTEGSGEKHKTVTSTSVTKEVNQNKSNSEKNTTNKDGTTNDRTLNLEKSLNSKNAFEKAKRIYFRQVDKTHTLAYVLRTSFGYKQAILRTVLTLTFEQFLELTHIYEGNELYNDNHIAEYMYRYVFRTPFVWPTNLYIELKNLYKFLHKNNIFFENYSTMLTYISPKLLHWSDLLSCTNILDCVKIDFEKRTGKILDFYDIKILKQECIEYYNRCWKHEKWLGETPLIEEEFYNKHLKDITQDDATMLDASSPQEVAAVPAEAVNNVAAVNESLVCVQRTREMHTSTKAAGANKEFNCVYLPNTQQQIEMLPADPLDNCDNALNLNVSSSTTESCEVVSVDELIQPIKTEQIEGKLLSNIIFYEDDNSVMQCLNCEEEIVCLDNTMDTHVVEENLPPPQMDFEDSVERSLHFLMNSDDSNLVMSLAQRIPSSIKSNHGTLCTQQFMQPSPSAEFTSTQLPQWPDVGLKSSGENQVHENIPETHLQDFNAAKPIQEENKCLEEHDTGEQFLEKFLEQQAAQLFPSTVEANQMIGENSSSVQSNIPFQPELAGKETSNAETEIINTVSSSTAEQQQQQVNMVAKTIDPTSHNSKTVQPFLDCKNSCQSNKTQTRLPIRQCITKTNVATKNSKNIAKVKPLTKSGLVPQIQHNTRPLQTIPVYAAGSSSNGNQALPPLPEISAPTSVMLSLTPSSNNGNPTGQSTQNSTFQLQLSNLGGQIFISQEMNKNCSVFDNSSLLRIVDHNYHRQPTTELCSAAMSQSVNEEVVGNLGTIDEQQPSLRIARNICICPVNNTLANSGKNQNDNEQSDNTNEQTCTITTTTANQQQCCPRIVTRDSNILYGTSDKVNNPVLKTHTNNLVTAITVTIHKQTAPRNCHKMIRKICLYREVIKFHYIKKLTTQYISEYLLPNLEIGKSYSEALIACENFKTRISNRSISALFPFWSQTIQRDFLLVLDDLKEFHYTVYDRVSMQKQEDLRTRILYWLLNTAPSFSLCQFIYDVHNSEFSRCESIRNGNNPSYKRKPFKCLTNALNPKVLGKLREMKKDLNMYKYEPCWTEAVFQEARVKRGLPAFQLASYIEPQMEMLEM